MDYVSDTEDVFALNLGMEATQDETEIVPVFLLQTAEDKVDFATWVLEISDDERMGKLETLKGTNASFRVLLGLLEKIGSCTVVLEDHYVDRVYRDSYYFHYSGKHFTYDRYCRRICIFNGKLEKEFFESDEKELEKQFLGSLVIRPIPNRAIGRTLLHPKLFLSKYPGFIRLMEYNITIYGKRLRVQAFPYSMQDGETTSCAEITILNLLDYYSQKYSEYHYMLPSTINQLAERNSYERRIPTVGLSYELISKVFCEAGFYPRLYSSQKMEKSKFRRIMHYYIASGIPIALGLKMNESTKHSVIGIGYAAPNKNKIDNILTCTFEPEDLHSVWTCDTADTVDYYCIMDDNIEPYAVILCEEREEVRNDKTSALYLGKYEIEYMMVPLYKRMYLEAADAYDICLSVLANKTYSIPYLTQYSDAIHALAKEYDDIEGIGGRDNPLVIRMFMASSRSFRKHRDYQFRKNNLHVRDIYNFTIFPKFVWVCELSTRKMYQDNKILGELIIDATASADAKADGVIIVHYPGVICFRMPEDIEKHAEGKVEKIEEWQAYPAFDGNLSLIISSEEGAPDNSRADMG